MNWVRVAVGIGDDPRIHQLAEALDIRGAEAVGLVVGVMVRMPEHAPDGNLSAVPASLLERWAGWEGQRGAFAGHFATLFLTEGKWVAWEKHNGKALQKLERDRERIAMSRDSRATNARQVGDGRAGVAGTDGRTDVRTAFSASSRINGNGNGNGTSASRVGSGDLIPIRPHLPAVLVAPAFCPSCGDGEPVENEKGRIVGKRHKAGCTHGEAA